MDGELAREIETSVLRMLRASGAQMIKDSDYDQFDGYSESWSMASFNVKSIKELMRLTEEYEEMSKK